MISPFVAAPIAENRLMPISPNRAHHSITGYWQCLRNAALRLKICKRVAPPDSSERGAGHD